MALESIEHSTEWLVESTIASGGMGTVYEARQLGNAGFEKRVAIKVLKEAASKDPLYMRQLVDEAKLCANLVHENIVQIYQLLFQNNRYVVVMELCRGVTLRRFVKRHVDLGIEVPVDMAAFIGSRVCRALHYAHTRCDDQGEPLGIVHRDVCPNNILISTGGVVKLADFGIAKASFIPNEEGQVLQGKARYMSPEQAGFEVTDARSDVFSLGVVIYEMLAGAGLFHGQSTVRTIMNVRTMDVPSIASQRDDVPESLQAILECALQRDPERRFLSAGDMGYQLEFYLYKDGFGPTNEKLRAYMRTILPELFTLRDPKSSGVEPTSRFGVPAPRPSQPDGQSVPPLGPRDGDALTPTARLGPRDYDGLDLAELDAGDESKTAFV